MGSAISNSIVKNTGWHVLVGINDAGISCDIKWSSSKWFWTKAARAALYDAVKTWHKWALLGKGYLKNSHLFPKFLKGDNLSSAIAVASSSSRTSVLLWNWVQMDSSFIPFLPPFYSNLVVPSDAQKVSVLISSRLFPVDSHYIHACLCLPQMVQMPREPKANTWEDAGSHRCCTQGSACCISATESAPWAVPETPPGCSAVTLPAFSKRGTRAESWRSSRQAPGTSLPPQL